MSYLANVSLVYGGCTFDGCLIFVLFHYPHFTPLLCKTLSNQNDFVPLFFEQINILSLV